MRSCIRLFALLLGLTIAHGAHAAFGDKDCSFGINGARNLAINGPPGFPGTIAGTPLDATEEPAGTLLVRAGFTNGVTEDYRLSANGTTVDPLRSATTSSVRDPAEVLQSDGGILFSNGIGGGVEAAPPGVGRLLSTGALDTAFGTNGYASASGFTLAASAPLLQTDGRIVVGGTATNAALVRFNANGTVDATFGSGGIAPNAAAGTIYVSAALQADGRILALGTTTLSRHGTDGQLDATFGSAGIADLSGVFAAAAQVRVQPSGAIIVVGWDPGNTHLRIARYTAAGALDTTVAGGLGYRDVSFGGAFLGSPAPPLIPLFVMADGRPVVAGQLSTSTGAFVRYGVDLADDASASVDFPPSFVYVLQSGRLLSGASNNPLGSVRRLLGDADAANCISTTTTVSSAPNPSSYQQSVVLTATVTPASGPAAQGTVQFRTIPGFALGSPVAVTNGTGTLSISTLAEGDTTIVADFTGAVNTDLLPSTSASYVHTVTPRPPSSTTLASSANPSYFGQSLTLTAVVSATGSPTGTVTFRDSTHGALFFAPVTGGSAVVTTTLLRTGNYSITAIYSGDAAFAPSTSAALGQVVLPSVTINDPSANPAAGPTTMTFTVTLTGPSAATVSVDYATQDHTATAGVDYTATSGTLTFAPGETSKTVAVPIMGQAFPAPTHDFFLALSNPVNTALAKGAGVGTLNYVGSGALSIFIDDPVVEEGNAGVTLMGFALSLSQPFTAGTVTVSYATANGTASAGTDYTAQSGTITFAKGQTHRWIVVPVNGNTTVDGNRTFFVNLSNAVGGSAVIARNQGTGTIVDDDPAPAATSVPVYRLYSDVTKEHLYTTDANEYAVLATRGWAQEGRAWTIFNDTGTFGTQNTIPLYRMYNPFILQHHWTTDSNEVMVLSSYGSWDYEGISGYILPAPDTGTTPLYRLMLANPPLHLWTIDANEMTVLSSPSRGWVYEGSIGEVLP